MKWFLGATAKMSDAIKVLTIDDHLVVQEGITAMLESEKGIKVVGQASNAQDALSQLNKLAPDIVLMDLKMPGVDGIQLTRMVRNRLPSCQVIMLTLYDQYVGEAIQAGAKGYLLKDITREELIDSIKQVYAGGEVFDKRVRPIIKVDYEEKPEEEAKEASEEVSSILFDQARVFILPPADVGASLRLTSVLEEAVSGDFRQVEGTYQDGITVTFKLNNPLPAEEINRRLSKVPSIMLLQSDALAEIDNSQNLARQKQQKFDIKHPSVKTVFVRLAH